ncbi:CPBP family intramembrane glutamic endopeptidase [Promicromonospora vindobonensis]|uniref:CPBP family intramembrane glutamic endopeptidase n=1 Tax=Promicromonospora vindobonensis TaxID=195748 RepID=A0ABW5VWD2_9MICO
MAVPRTDHRLLAVAWCVLAPLGVVTAYLGLGLGAVSVVGEPIGATALLGAVVIVLVGLMRVARLRWLDYTPAPHPTCETSHFGLFVGACAVLAFLAGQSLALWLYTTAGSAGFDESLRAKADAGAAVTVLLALVIAPIAEEMLFRGLLYPLLRRHVSVVGSVLVTTAVFGLVHGNAVQLVAVLPLAILLALVYERTRRLWPCVLLHLGFNLAAILVPAPALVGLSNPVAALLLGTVFAGVAMVLCQTVVLDPLAPAAADGPGGDR